jgi:hypothetical protein
MFVQIDQPVMGDAQETRMRMHTFFCTTKIQGHPDAVPAAASKKHFSNDWHAAVEHYHSRLLLHNIAPQ